MALNALPWPLVTTLVVFGHFILEAWNILAITMKFLLPAVALCAVTLAAQTPNLSGVWKVNPDKSTFAGPPPSNYLMIIEQEDSKISFKMAIGGRHGVERSSYTFNLGGKASMNNYRGLPMRTEAAWNNGVLVLDSKTAGYPSTMTMRYSLTGDGAALTVDTTVNANGKETRQTQLFDKQPDAAGEPLRQPEATAGATYKNVLILKDVPHSDFINAMRTFSMSLGSDCLFCHVEGKFEADDKPAKAMARKMITMTHAINDQNFGGHQEVRCFTCHQGNPEPHARPAFQN